MTDDLHSLAAPYALDALDDIERRRFEDHLGGCESCRREVDALADVATLLVAEDVQPPVELRGSTMSLIAQTPQADAVPLPADGTPTPAGSPSPPSEPDGWNAQQWVLSAVAVLLVVAALAAVAIVANRTSGNDSTDEIAAVLDAPDAIHIPMTTDDPARASTDLQVVHSPDHNATVVIGDHVHGTDPGQTYQMWGITAEGPVPAGVFDPSGDGTVEAPVATPEGVEGWVVTVEPAGGLPAPSGDPVFTSDA